ncbi:HlyD family secretion protein [Flavobacterium sp. CS20]|uniref:HlyD family secretion protein n=1 Tax=Flavobacterium sp. CS20 TaxID=2775246 RepID=UPI001B39E460|nr:HlyD family efflux transporter periplasmic adaptor subunit [Flavobacterium sp. CS20]QTY27191.1 HlyD family efflux transporter periplasmic adaptor subunit [Flavobacterium sp. CS20]
MLNISKYKLNKEEELSQFESMKFVNFKNRYITFNKIMTALGIVFLVFMFLPWTQNVRGSGYVTTLNPSQRPQAIQSAIPGRIEKWYVGEGDEVKKGDTIVFISEIKSEYFDPKLLDRTQAQITSKSFSQSSYTKKAEQLSRQIVALRQERELKLEETRNKLIQAKLQVKSDSIDLEVAKTQISIAQRQFERIEQLETEGLKSRTDLENKKLKLQESEAKLVSQQNKLLSSRNKVLNAQIEISTIRTSYDNKISKAESDRLSALSAQYDTEAQVSKLENELSNYSMRSDLKYIKAPQDGFINRAIQKGIGETFKEGAEIVSIMPTEVELAVETYVRPIDLPLMHPGEEVRIIFDGWPAIFFSGWPNLSYGTYGGKIVAVERSIDPSKGKYRVLIKPNENETGWPDVIRAGSGAKTLALLKDVPIWYEIWRQINGFPPDYYLPTDNNTNTNKNQNTKK